MTDIIERDPLVEAARARLQEAALKLCAKIDPLDVASSYLVVGMVILARQIGKEPAGKYLRKLAAELEGDNAPGWGGSA
jgi:hypothetical protein